MLPNELKTQLRIVQDRDAEICRLKNVFRKWPEETSGLRKMSRRERICKIRSNIAVINSLPGAPQGCTPALTSSIRCYAAYYRLQ